MKLAYISLFVPWYWFINVLEPSDVYLAFISTSPSDEIDRCPMNYNRVGKLTARKLQSPLSRVDFHTENGFASSIFLYKPFDYRIINVLTEL